MFWDVSFDHTVYSKKNDDIEAIDKEDGFPMVEDKIKIWIDNLRFVYNGLHFNMSISTIVSMKHLKDIFLNGEKS